MPDVQVELPWTCLEHPQAQIRHLWDQSHYVLNGYPAGTGVQSNHRYECVECGRELAATLPVPEAQTVRAEVSDAKE
jgi:hypothetical protein